MLILIFSLFVLSNQSVLAQSEPIFDIDINATEILEALNYLPETVCTLHLLLLGRALLQGDMWALKMLDATAKPQAGIMMGNIMHVGNYDECLEVNAKLNRTLIQGKYCTAIFTSHPKHGSALGQFFGSIMEPFRDNDDENQLADDARLTYGFCLPKVCTAEDLQEIVNLIEDSLQSPLHFVFDDKFCDGGDGQEFTKSAIFAIVLFSIFATLLILGTLYEYFVWKKLKDTDKQPDFLMAFSVITNGKKLLSTSSPEGSLHCLDGLRVISMMWIVLTHGVQYSFYVPHVNSVKILEWQNQTRNSIILAGAMSVDTFFVISGLLVVFLFMKGRARGAKFNIPMFYIHRLLRLTPSLAMVILLTATLLVHMGNGPFWPIVEDMFQKSCKENWWSTLIYLQNYIHPNNQCVGQAWYLAVDTQMYFLSPLLFFPLVKWPKQTIGAIVVFIILNCSYVFEITFKKHLGTMFFNQDEIQYSMLYVPTHVRGTTYLIGMICGYFAYQTKTGSLKLKLTTRMAVIIWVFCLVIIGTIVFAHSLIITVDEYSALDSSFFNSFTRIGWSIALSIIILLCINNYGGVINSFLSNKIFTVLIRLNYSIYLIHMHILIVIMAQGRTPTYFSNLMGYHRFWGDYAFTLGASALWTLAFESPVITLEKVFFGKRKPKAVNNSLNDSVTIQVTDSSNGLRKYAVNE